MSTGVDKRPFNMKDDPVFQKVGLACVLAMRRSRELGIGTKRKQVGHSTIRVLLLCH